MTKKPKYNYYISSLSACGFKVVKQSELKNYYISNVKTNGDKRISYLIKNNLLNSIKDQSKEPLTIELIFKN